MRAAYDLGCTLYISKRAGKKVTHRVAFMRGDVPLTLAG